MMLPEETVFFPRMYIVMYALFSMLRATLPVRAINDDMDDVAEPVTPLGIKHHDWLRRAACPVISTHAITAS